MQKWEYLEVHHQRPVSGGKIEFSLNGVLETHDSFSGLFNRLGEQGWELVAVTDAYYFYFKRPKR